MLNKGHFVSYFRHREVDKVFLKPEHIVVTQYTELLLDGRINICINIFMFFLIKCLAIAHCYLINNTAALYLHVKYILYHVQTINSVFENYLEVR